MFIVDVGFTFEKVNYNLNSVCAVSYIIENVKVYKYYHSITLTWIKIAFGEKLRQILNMGILIYKNSSLVNAYFL